MEKPEFSKMANTVKTNIGGFAEKVKSGTSGAAISVKETAGEIVKTNKERLLQRHDNDTEIVKADKKGKPEKKKKGEEKIKLDDALQMAVDQYNDAYTIMNDNGTTLYTERMRAVDMIVNIENLINSIANRPKAFDAKIAEIKTHRETFTEACEFAKMELEAAKKSALGASAGVAAGAAIVSVAPTVAMWVATTFGTASTGTAISALSGAAATNAALAWLGGGALAAGGGGMAAGHAFLALAGPVGWGVAGVTLISSIVLFSLNKFKLGKKKKEEIENVKNNTANVKTVSAKIEKMLEEVIALRGSLGQQYDKCLVVYGCDFMSISKELQMQLGTLVNNTKALSVSLGRNSE